MIWGDLGLSRWALGIPGALEKSKGGKGRVGEPQRVTASLGAA